ncbi:DUF4333 domain-containing protein [Parasphingorhabdus pacifica]
MSNPYGPGQPQWGQPQWGQPQAPGPYAGYGQQGGYGNPGHGQQQGGYGRPVPAQPPSGPAGADYGQFPPAQHQPPQHQPPQQPVYPPSTSGGVPEPPRKRRSALPWILGSLLMLIAGAIVLVLGFVSPGWFVGNVFDTRSVELGVKQTLEDSYRISGVESVSCPAEEPVEPGHSFVCDAHISGEAKAVAVTVKDEDGIYEVGHPG